MVAQILWGSLVLFFCAVIHIGILVVAVPLIKMLDEHSKRITQLLRSIILLFSVFAFIILSHTIQVWLWAICFLIIEALADLEQAIYFSIVTYTTVGYGDVTLSSEHRIFAAMASVTGLLNFGVSTAFLVTFIQRIAVGQLDKS